MRERKLTAKSRKSNGRKSVSRPRAAIASGSDVRPLREVVATNLRRARTNSHLSVKQLAAKADVPADFVEKVERGELPDLVLGALEALADALGIEAADLTARRPSEEA